MTDTLFDLDTLAASPVISATDWLDSLEAEINLRATLRTKAASDAIALWASSDRLPQSDPLLSGEFVDLCSMNRWTVANTAVADAGDLVVRLVCRVGRGREYLLHAARRSSDGSIVDATGQKMLPASLVPPEDGDADGGLYLGGSFELGRLIGRRNGWGRFRPLSAERDEADYVDAMSSVVELPAHLIPSLGAPISDRLCDRLLALQVRHLAEKVRQLQGAPHSRESIFAAAALLRQNRWPGGSRFNSPSEADFSPDEAAILAPLLEMFDWGFSTERWDVSVELDTSYGWNVRIGMTATGRKANEAPISVEVSVAANDEDALVEWFRPETRQTAALRALAAHMDEQAASSDAPKVGFREKPERAKIRLAEKITALRESVRFLKDHASTAEQFAAVAVADRTLGKAAHRMEELAAAMSAIDAEVAEHRVKAAKRAEELMRVRDWTPMHNKEAKELAEFTARLSDIAPCYSESGRMIDAMVESLAMQPSVIRVSRNFWAAVDHHGNLHGAVSSSGFYSNSGRGSTADARMNDEETARSHLSHLFEARAERCDALKHLFRSDECPHAFAAWLKSLPYAPELNDARRAATHLTGLIQSVAIRKTLELVVAALESATVEPEQARGLLQSLKSTFVQDDRERTLAEMASRLLQARFGGVAAERVVVGDTGLFGEGEADESDDDVEDEEVDDLLVDDE